MNTKIPTTALPPESPSRERNFSSENAERLDSWKEIASYLNRNVRTVQRWEAFESMPVHRHFHAKAGSVHAFRSELDAWRKRRSDRHPPGGEQTRPAQPAGQRLINDQEQANLRIVLEAMLVQFAAQVVSAVPALPGLALELQNRETTSELSKSRKASRNN